MKKSIIYLGLAFALSFNAVSANNGMLKDYNPLCIAISKSDNDTAKKIIEYGGDVNERYNGMTPLMLAARYNNVEMIRLLLEKGAVASDKDTRGNTALKYAELSNATEAIDFLKALKN